MNLESIEKKLEQFKCLRCQQCCKQPGFVYLTETDIRRMAVHLGKTPFDFVNEFCELENRRSVVLKKLPDEACIFLNETGCSIHEAKPEQCEQFPVKWRTSRSLEYCEGMKVLDSKD